MKNGVLVLGPEEAQRVILLRGQWSLVDGSGVAHPMAVPGNWADQGIPLHSEGLYELRLEYERPPESPQTMYLPASFQQVEISINEKRYTSKGSQGIHENAFLTASFLPLKENRIQVRIRNEFFRMGGLFIVPRLGPRHRVNGFLRMKVFWHGIRLGLLLFVLLYHLFLFINRFSSRSSLYLALATSAALVRDLIAGEGHHIPLLQWIPWTAAYRLEFFTVYLYVAFLFLFVMALFPSHRRFEWVISRSFSHSGMLLAFLALVLPIPVLARTFPVAIGYTVLLLLLLIVFCVLAVLGRKRGAVIFLLGVVQLTAFSGMEILYRLGLCGCGNISLWGLVIFVLIQTFVLARHYGDSHRRLDFLTKTLEQKVRERTGELEDANTALRKEIEIRVEVERKLQILSSTDGLTGLANRNRIEQELERIHRRFLRYGSPFSVAMADLDHFKAVNDHFGHDVGDEALVFFAHTSEEMIRDVDLIGRWGGEEFVIIFPDIHLQEAAAAADRLRAEIAKGHERIPKLTVSIGLAELKDPGETLDALIRRADQNLYRAKRGGRNQVAF